MATFLEDRAFTTPARRTAVVGLAAAVPVAAALLLWAKWAPYVTKSLTLAGTHSWSGSDILAVGGVQPGDAPSWHAATSFADVYLLAIWKALLAAVLISALIQAFVSRGWLLKVLGRRRHLSAAAVGGLISTPSMMCTCCTAPVAATLRRDGVPTAAAVAYWLGNPLLNPAVLVFLAFVAPWQWAATRLVVGALLVVGGATLVARLVDDRRGGEASPAATAAAPPVADRSASEVDGGWLALAPQRFGRAVLRLALTVLPEYVIVVLLVGAFRGWLFPFGGSALHTGVLVVVVAAVLGTLAVIPTAGEIPILQGLALAGLSLGGVGALLITLPAASLPAMSMVLRSFGWRTTTATAGATAVAGMLGGALLTVL